MKLLKTSLLIAALAVFALPAVSAPRYYFDIVVSFPGSSNLRARGYLDNKKDPLNSLPECRKALRVAQKAAQKNELKIESAVCRKVAH